MIFIFLVEPENEKKITLEALPASVSKAHDYVFINELKLSDFKQILNRNNISAEFCGKTLKCIGGTGITKVELPIYINFYSSFGFKMLDIKNGVRNKLAMDKSALDKSTSEPYVFLLHCLITFQFLIPANRLGSFGFTKKCHML